MKTVLDLSSPRVLRTQEELDDAIAEIDRLLDLNPQSPGGDHHRLEILSLLVEDYESRHRPADGGDPTPQQVVDFMLEQRGMKRDDLARLLGKGVVTGFFRGQRVLSGDQIDAIGRHLHIPAALLSEVVS